MLMGRSALHSEGERKYRRSVAGSLKPIKRLLFRGRLGACSHCISGAKDRDKRPAFDSHAQGRNAARVRHDRGLARVDRPGRKAMFQMLSVFAEFERAMIVSRVNAGLEVARANGRPL